MSDKQKLLDPNILKEYQQLKSQRLQYINDTPELLSLLYDLNLLPEQVKDLSIEERMMVIISGTWEESKKARTTKIVQMKGLAFDLLAAMRRGCRTVRNGDLKNMIELEKLIQEME